MKNKYICFIRSGINQQEIFAKNLRSAKTIYRSLYAQFEKDKDIGGYKV